MGRKTHSHDKNTRHLPVSTTPFNALVDHMHGARVMGSTDPRKTTINQQSWGRQMLRFGPFQRCQQPSAGKKQQSSFQQPSTFLSTFLSILDPGFNKNARKQKQA
jgi:hypothetical protein